ncbi:carbohydrate kinase family protein [Sinorhizobium mexicanum]|uniref:Carbohydrate kinase family protein n=1 Tax=Sinorhizobium mexicanum TaxID=375549 RepID=A0A859QRI6_9HYPH|nr:PfkB family carbohydrate kinase [Sinorhizobium mexicanum]MBP1886788.1 sugar/nucleoside kinase (ribokinase family) [Sinorhizobium mexicanum]QLL65995.1 carbohydrate kinase family protein [Sinorhizobium mexicanum]
MRPLAVIGNVNIDLILGPAEPWPKAGTEIIVDHDELRVGGCAGNSALAWDSLGVDYAIAANVGNDQFGIWLKDAFGGRAREWPVEAVGTTLSVGITHPDGERTFFTTRGHLPLFSFDEVRTMLDGERLRGGCALLAGSFLTDALTHAYDAFFDWADAHDIAVALDTGWPLEGWTEANKRKTLDWLKRCHCALFNEVETTTLTGETDPGEAARHLKARMPSEAIVVVKRGPHGALALDQTGAQFSVPAPRVNVVDTIGAGDVFNAGFLAALTADLPLEQCLGVGVTVASEAISTLPRSYGKPLSAFLEETRT